MSSVTSAPLPAGTAPADGEELRVRRSSATTRVAGIAFLAVVVVLALAPFWGDPSTLNSLVRLCTLVAIAQMWNLLAGYAGRVSIGMQAFIGIGGYTLVLFGNNTGINVFACVLIAGVVSAAIAVPVAALAFRLQGGYFAIGTWVIAEVIRLIVANVDSLGGGTGTSITAVIGIDITTRQRVTFWLALGLAVLSVVVVVAVLRTRLGLGLAAARDAPAAARALGVSIPRAQLVAFVIAAAGIGVAGAIIYLNLLRVTPNDAFSVDWTAFMIFMVVIGGLGTVEGPVLGAVVFFVLEQLLDGSTYLIVLGLVAIAVTLRLPGGLWGLVAARTGLRLVPVTPRVLGRARRRDG